MSFPAESLAVSIEVDEISKQKTKGLGKKRFQCRFCRRLFARHEHLQRHERLRMHRILSLLRLLTECVTARYQGEALPMSQMLSSVQQKVFSPRYGSLQALRLCTVTSSRGMMDCRIERPLSMARHPISAQFENLHIRRMRARRIRRLKAPIRP